LSIIFFELFTSHILYKTKNGFTQSRVGESKTGGSINYQKWLRIQKNLLTTKSGFVIGGNTGFALRNRFWSCYDLGILRNGCFRHIGIFACLCFRHFFWFLQRKNQSRQNVSFSVKSRLQDPRIFGTQCQKSIWATFGK